MNIASPIRRIAWIEPSRLPFDWPDQNIYSGILFPRAGPKMAGLLTSLGYEVEVISEEVSRIEPDEIANKFDLACISVLSNTAPHGMVMGRWLTERGLPVVMGGYQFAHKRSTPDTLAPTEEALDFVPYVIRGEGYGALPKFLTALQGGAPFHSVPGISFRDESGATQHIGTASNVTPEEYAALPLADWSVVRDVEKIQVGAVHGMEGCPRNCSFCAVWRRDGHGKSRTPAEVLVDELEALLRHGDIKHCFFSADNFPVIHTWAAEVCEEIIRRDVKVGWTCQAEVGTIRRPELVDLMVRAGCERWCLGLESIDEHSLADSNKRQDRKLMEECIHGLHRRGIHVHGMFIVGLPHDTPETIRATVRWAKRMKLETVQFLCLSDLPGSQDYEEYQLWDHTFRPFEGAYAPLNWIFINGHYARVITPRMTLAEVQEWSIKAMMSFYSLPRMIGGLLCPNTGALRAARERGAGLWHSLGHGFRHSLTAGMVRLKGYGGCVRWLKSDFNRTYRRLVAATPERAEELRHRLLELLPPEWLHTLEQVHEERLARRQAAGGAARPAGALLG